MKTCPHCGAILDDKQEIHTNTGDDICWNCPNYANNESFWEWCNAKSDKEQKYEGNEMVSCPLNKFKHRTNAKTEFSE